jgi:hypothetical protein
VTPVFSFGVPLLDAWSQFVQKTFCRGQVVHACIVIGCEEKFYE